MKLRVTRKSYSRREGGKLVTYRPGDKFDGTETALKQFGDRLTRDNTPDEPKQAHAGGVDPDVQAVLNSNADDAEGMLGALSDDQLDELAGLETRKGVSRAVADEKAAR